MEFGKDVEMEEMIDLSTQLKEKNNDIFKALKNIMLDIKNKRAN